MRIFAEDIAREREHSESKIWGNIYRELFPDMTDYDRCMHAEAQKRGIDRIITLSDGHQHTIEEKIRYKDYNDIALERWSSFEDKSLGWCLKELDCDYVLYLFWNSGRYFLIPFEKLRQSLMDNILEWENNYKILQTRNRGVRSMYTTVSVCVPTSVLIDVIPEIRYGEVENE